MSSPKRKGIAFILSGLAIAFVLAIFVSPFANPNPDGLESAVLKSACANAADPEACLEEKAGEARWDRAPLPDYGGDAGPALSGLIGVAATFLIGYGALVLARSGKRGKRDEHGSGSGPESGSESELAGNR
jgi:cobalt/nickel transport protein